MAERNYDALLVSGGAANNPPMYSLANGAKVTEATILVKKRGEDPVIFANPMERDEAAKAGLRVIELSKYNYRTELLKQEKGNRLRATARLYGKILAEVGAAGNGAAFGRREQGEAHQMT